MLGSDIISASPEPKESSKSIGITNIEQEHEEYIENDDDEEDLEEDVEVESGKGEEGDWEWEYYETEGEEKSEEPQEVEESQVTWINNLNFSKRQVFFITQESTAPQPESSDPWIVQGLSNLVLKVPRR